jgi:YVTN family beta-propeller protein
MALIERASRLRATGVTASVLLAVLTVGSSPALAAGHASVATGSATVYVSNTGSGTVTEIPLPTNGPSAAIPIGGRPYGLALRPNGRTLYVTDYSLGTLTPIDLTTHHPDPPIRVGPNPTGIAITPTAPPPTSRTTEAPASPR